MSSDKIPPAQSIDFGSDSYFPAIRPRTKGPNTEEEPAPEIHLTQLSKQELQKIPDIAEKIGDEINEQMNPN